MRNESYYLFGTSSFKKYIDKTAGGIFLLKLKSQLQFLWETIVISLMIIETLQ